MATLLSKPLAREIDLGDQPYKIVISPEGVRMTRKGGRKGAELKWDAILALGQVSEPAPSPQCSRTSDVPTPIAADIAKEVRTATDALARARTALSRAGSIPAALLMEVSPDVVYGRSESHTDWYIEPLLTPAEVASILRISRSAVTRLGILSVDVAGERRYRQSELRRYVAAHESRY
jgi:hypothetical protein